MHVCSGSAIVPGMSTSDRPNGAMRPSFARTTTGSGDSALPDDCGTAPPASRATYFGISVYRISTSWSPPPQLTIT
jgi:hypothetical protein